MLACSLKKVTSLFESLFESFYKDRMHTAKKIISEYEIDMMTLTLINLFLGRHGQSSKRDEMLGPTDEK